MNEGCTDDIFDVSTTTDTVSVDRKYCAILHAVQNDFDMISTISRAIFSPTPRRVPYIPSAHADRVLIWCLESDVVTQSTAYCVLKIGFICCC